MSCRADVLKLDEVLWLLKSGALGLNSGIASFDVEGNRLHLVCSDGRDLYIEFPMPYNGSKIVNMFINTRKNELVIQQRVEAHVQDWRVPLPPLHGIEDVIDAQCTVGGVPKGKHYPVGFSLEEIVRQILSGHPYAPKVDLVMLDDRYDKETDEYLLDITIPESIDKIDLAMSTQAPPEDETLEIEDVWFQVPFLEDIHEIVGDPRGETYRENDIDLSENTLSKYPEREYYIKAYAKDNMGHVGQDTATVQWIYPQYVGIYDGRILLPFIKNKKYIKPEALEHPELFDDFNKFIPVEELSREQWVELLDVEDMVNTETIVPVMPSDTPEKRAEHEKDEDDVDFIFLNHIYDNPDYDPISDWNNDPERNPDYAIIPFYDPESPDFNPKYNSNTPRTFEILHHFVQHDNNMEYEVEYDITGRVIIAYDVTLGQLANIEENGEYTYPKYHYGSHIVESYEGRQYLIYISDIIKSYKSGDVITVEGR